jgi:hypothetical protein
MPSTNLSDTDQKITMKDHDILIATYTLQQENLRRQDDDRRAAVERGQQISLELRTISIEQARITTEFKNLQDDNLTLLKRVERLESKSNVWDAVNSLGIVVSGAIGYFFGNK